MSAALAEGPRSRAGKHHSTASAWTVKQKSSKRYRLEEHELFKLGDGAQVYADVYKVDSDQPEERLEKETFTHGFKPLVSTLTFEHDRLPLQQFRAKRFDLRRKINDLRSRSRKKKYADNPIPGLVQVSAEERASFIARLSDLQVPLGDLAQSVPFGFKADILLDMMVARKVAPQRATWLIKVVYLNLYTDKNKARGGVRRQMNDRKLKCKDDWSEQLQQYVSRSVQADLQSPDGASRRAYLLSLVAWQYRAGLISRVKTLYWIIGQLDDCAVQDAALLQAAFYLPLVCRFIEDVQMSRMHSYRLFTACAALVKKTQVGRAIHHETKTNICNVSEAILRYLNDAIPLSRHWRGVTPTQSAALSLTTMTSAHFNLPRFLLDLDCVRESSATCAIVNRVSAILQTHGQTAVDALLHWSISRHRIYHKFRALVTSFLLAQFRNINDSVGDLIVAFLCRFEPSCTQEADQAVIVFSELSKSGLYDAARALRMMVAHGLIGNAADPQSARYVFCRYVLEWVPFSDHSPRYIVAQRSLYLYGARSTYDNLLRKRLLATVCQHLDRRSLGQFLSGLAQIDAEAHSIATNPEFVDFNDELNASWKKFVCFEDPARTDLRSIMSITALYHLVPILNICVAVFLHMGRTAATETRMLPLMALGDTFQALVTALHVTSQYSLLCSFLISALDECSILQRAVIDAVRASYPLFQCLSLEVALRSACAALMRRDLQTVQQAEIWIANARLPSSLTRWLSENVVQKFFSGRYHSGVVPTPSVGPDQLQHELLTLMKSINPDTRYDQVDEMLSRIAVDNQSIGAIVNFILDQILAQTENPDCVVPRALHLLHRVCLASDRLGDNRVPCHDIILSRYVSKVTDLLSEPTRRAVFLALSVQLINSGLLRLDIFTERIIVRPLRIALTSKSSSQGAAVACLLASTLFGGTLAGFDPDAHYLMQCGLMSESVATVFPVVTLLAELGLHSDITELTNLARMSLDSVLTSRLFVQFCLTSLHEVYGQIVNLPSARWLLRCMCSDRHGSLPVYDADDFDEESIASLLSSVSPWTVHFQWMDVQLAVQAQNRRRPASNAEQQLAQYLLVRPNTDDDVISADIAVELVKLLPSLIGKHILNAVQASLIKENKAFLESISSMDVVVSVTHLSSHLVNNDHGGDWRISSESAVHALSISLPAGDCIGFVSSLSEQLMEIVQNLSMYSDSPHLQPLVLEHIMRRVRCLQYMTSVALQRPAECHFHDLVRALLTLLLSDIFLQADEAVFDAALAVFERLIDDLRFGENAPADGSAAQRKDDDFIISLDRECTVPIPFGIRRKVQRTLPTFSGAIVDYRPTCAAPTAAPVQIAPVTTPSAMSPTNLFVMQSASTTTATVPPTSIVSVEEELYAVDPWTILQGVPGIPLVQKLLEHSCIVTRDGSSIDTES